MHRSASGVGRPVSCESESLLCQDSEISDCVLHFQIDSYRRSFRARVDPASVAFLEAADIGVANQTGRAGRKADAGRQVNGRITCARLYAHAVAAGRHAAQVDENVAGADVDVQALQMRRPSTSCASPAPRLTWRSI